MTAKALWTSTGKVEPVQAGESSDIVATFHDMAGGAIVKANLATLTVTLYDRTTYAVINSRSAQSVKDANNGTVATDGTLRLRLGASYHVIVGASVAVCALEEHVVRLQWTWNDCVETLNGFDEWVMSVERMSVPT
jgi:hypothetical protein